MCATVPMHRQQGRSDDSHSPAGGDAAPQACGTEIARLEIQLSPDSAQGRTKTGTPHVSKTRRSTCPDARLPAHPAGLRLAGRRAEPQTLGLTRRLLQQRCLDGLIRGATEGLRRITMRPGRVTLRPGRPELPLDQDPHFWPHQRSGLPPSGLDAPSLSRITRLTPAT